MEPKAEYAVFGATHRPTLTVAHYPDGSAALARGDELLRLSAQECAWLRGALVAPGAFTRQEAALRLPYRVYLALRGETD